MSERQRVSSRPPSRQDLLEAMRRLHECEAEATVITSKGQVLPAPPGSSHDRQVKMKKRLLSKLLQKELGKIKTFSW